MIIMAAFDVPSSPLAYLHPDVIIVRNNVGSINTMKISSASTAFHLCLSPVINARHTSYP